PGVRDPLAAAHPWYVLCELTSARAADPVEDLLEQSLAGALAEGLVLDAAVARSARDRQAFWKLRETIPEAQRLDGRFSRACRELARRQRARRPPGRLRTRGRWQSALQPQPGSGQRSRRLSRPGRAGQAR